MNNSKSKPENKQQSWNFWHNNESIALKKNEKNADAFFMYGKHVTFINASDWPSGCHPMFRFVFFGL